MKALSSIVSVTTTKAMTCVSVRVCKRCEPPLFNITCADRPIYVNHIKLSGRRCRIHCTHLEEALEGGEHGPAVAREAVGRQPAVTFDYGKQIKKIKVCTVQIHGTSTPTLPLFFLLLLLLSPVDEPPEPSLGAALSAGPVKGVRLGRLERRPAGGHAQ